MVRGVMGFWTMGYLMKRVLLCCYPSAGVFSEGYLQGYLQEVFTEILNKLQDLQEFTIGKS
jgi:hypothetical protein